MQEQRDIVHIGIEEPLAGVGAEASLIQQRSTRRHWLGSGAILGVVLVTACGDVISRSTDPNENPVVAAPTAAPDEPQIAAPTATRPPETRMEEVMRSLPTKPSPQDLDRASKVWYEEVANKHKEHQAKIMAGEPIAPILQDARQHFMIGIDLAAKGTSGFTEKTSNTGFRTERNHYDLQDATDLYLGGAIIMALVQELQNQNSPVSYINVEQKGEIDQLKGAMTVLPTESAPFSIKVDSLSRLQRLRVGLGIGGKKLPSIWRPNTSYMPPQEGYDPNTKIATFNSFEPASVIYNHYLAQEYPAWFDQFKPVVENRPARTNREYADIDTSYPSTSEGKWRAILGSYINRGIELRRRIAWLENGHTLEAGNLQAQYNVLNQGFGGWETNYAVMPTINDGNFNLGDEVLVRDLLSDKHGSVLLHPDATVDIDGEGRNIEVPDRFSGKLVNGPRFPQNLKDWQRATVFLIESPDRLKAGWIPVEWLQKQAS